MIFCRKKNLLFLVKKIYPKNPVFKIKTESCTYIKELISGENGRTKQSLSEILKQKTALKKLVVKEVLI